MKTQLLLALAVFSQFSLHVMAQGTPVAAVAAKIVPGAKPDGSVCNIEGVVCSRAVLADKSVLIFVQQDKACVPVVVPATGKAPHIQDQVKVGGKFSKSSDGLIQVTASGDPQVVASKKAITSAEPASPAGLADPKTAATMTGRYLVWTNLSFDVTVPKFVAGQNAKLNAPNGAIIEILVTSSLDGRDKPTKSVNLFGNAALYDTPTGPVWRVVPSRFVPGNTKVMKEMAAKHTCFTCHNTDTKLVGPAYRDVAAKYKDDPHAEEVFINQIKTGGKGKWGPTGVMPPLGAKVPEADQKALAEWIHGYRWDAILSE